MFFSLGWKDFKRTKGMNLLIIMLLVVVFLTAISVVSAVEEKFKKYTVLSEYLNKNGVCFESVLLAREEGDEGNNRLLWDEKDVKEYLPNVKDVLSVEEIWEPFIIGSDTEIALWCYSSAVVKSLEPDMESGRWFRDSDMESDMLKAVVSYNEDLKPGDVVTLGNGFFEITQQVEIIGMMKDNESLFYTDSMGDRHKDYRDCYYTYNYESEEHKVLMLLADEQILKGEEQGQFEYFNPRLSSIGFQRQMCGPTILIYDDGVSEETINQDIDKLGKYSMLNAKMPLSKMNENSWDYILMELHNYLPVFICIFIFVIVQTISANAITVKKQLKNYAVYYICGLPWKNCARISLSVACITSGIAFGMVVFSICFLKLMGLVTDIALRLGPLQLLTCMIIILCYVLLAWSIPLGIVRNTSAKEIMTNNH
ncbi:MAG: hypothetical protein NC429_17470 [Lachnospiraceae bacterium]|nr:hypothetical protein [Lachnospiraceae bacterium]